MVNLAQWILLHAHNGSQYGEMIVSATLPLLKHSFLPYFILVGTSIPELSFPEQAQGCVISSARSSLTHSALSYIMQIQQATCLRFSLILRQRATAVTPNHYDQCYSVFRSTHAMHVTHATNKQTQKQTKSAIEVTGKCLIS